MSTSLKTKRRGSPALLGFLMMKAIKIAFQGLIVLLTVLLIAVWVGSYFVGFHHRMDANLILENGKYVGVARTIWIFRGCFEYSYGDMDLPYDEQDFPGELPLDVSIRNELTSNPKDELMSSAVSLKRIPLSETLIGFHYEDGMVMPPMRYHLKMIRFPIWVLFVPLVPVSLLIVRKAIRWKRYHWNHVELCAGCGYDLRESPVRCPECGRENDCEKRKMEQERMKEKLWFWKRGKKNQSS